MTKPAQQGIPDPTDVPQTEEEFKKRIADMRMQEPLTVWRVDRLRQMTYTQLWKLVGAGHVDWVQPTMDQRSLVVRTRDR